jgi:lipopolysaccharide cholinephosphotransferase
MRKAAEKDVGWAKNELFDILWRIGTPESYNEGISVAKGFADEGDGGAMMRLGRAYRDGKGVEKDLDEAAEWMRKAAEKDVGWAKNELFDILWRIGTPESYNEGISVAKGFADEGDGGAMMRLGRAYRDGKGVEKDLDEAAEWMRKASEKIWWLGREFVDNLMRSDKEEHHKEAFKVCTQIIEKHDDGETWGRLGRAYRDGKGVEKDLDEAAEWMRKAAEKDVGWAKNELFDILWRIGTPESYNEGISVAKGFADEGDGGAMMRLGRAYRDGKGVEKDINQAKLYYEGASIMNNSWNKEYVSFLEDLFTLSKDDNDKINLSFKLSEKGIKEYYIYLLNNYLGQSIDTDYGIIIKLSLSNDSLKSNDLVRFVNNIYERHQSLDPIITLCSEMYDEISPIDNTNNKKIIDCINQLLSIVEEIIEKQNLDYNLKSFFIGLYPFDKGYDVIHKGNNKILNKFDELCSNNEICYSLAFGTLLGAYRHEESIPWDDDIDVWVFRKDLIKIEKALENNEHLRLVKYIDVTSDTGRFFIAYKVKHKKSPLFLDIFILDHTDEYTSETWDEFRILEKQLIEDTNEIINDVSRPYIKNDKVNAIMEKYLIESHKRTNSNNGESGVMWGIDNCTMRKEFIFKEEDFLPYKFAKFGSRDYPIPNNPEKILTTIYGDIFKLPYDMISHTHYSENEIKTISNLNIDL